MTITNIYGLFDPRFPDVVMYVGKGLKKRALSHQRSFLRNGSAVNALLRRWFEKLKADGIEPTWRFLEENVADWRAAERKWISHWRLANPALCNVADGGNEWPDTDTVQLGRRLGGHIGGLIGGRVSAKHGGGFGIAWKQSPEKMRKICRLGGLRTGGKAFLRWATECPEEQATTSSKGGFASTHARWHIARSIQNPNCQLCCKAWVARRGDIVRLYEIVSGGF